MSSSTPRAAQVPQRVFDHREVPKAQEVHLQQAERLDPVHVELGHDLLRVVARVLRQLQRQVVHERGVADHHAGGVDRVLAAQPLEGTGGLDDLLGLGLLLVGRRQVGRELQRVFDRVVPAHHRRRVHLAEAVPHHRREAQHARGVADALLALDRLERDDLGDVVRAVLLGGVADHLVATTLVEVHVDVGHLDALGIEEALEQQAVAQRIEVGDAQAVRHHRAGRAAAAWPDADAVLARVADQVPHDQEVAAEPHRRDDPELVVDAVSHLGGDLGRSAAPRRLRPADGGRCRGRGRRGSRTGAGGTAGRRARDRRTRGRAPRARRSPGCCRTPRGSSRKTSRISSALFR